MNVFMLVLTATASLIFSFGSLPLAHMLGSLNDNNSLPEVWVWIANVAIVSALIIFGNRVITKIKHRGEIQSGNNLIEASSFFAILNKKWDKITKW
jgi:ABC-type multidrug transport system permease subunit